MEIRNAGNSNHVSPPIIDETEKTSQAKGIKSFSRIHSFKKKSLSGISNASTIFTEKTLTSRSFEIPKKNRFFSWCSKLVTSFQLRSCKTSEEKINLLKDKIDNGNLDFSRLRELQDSEEINSDEFIKLSVNIFKNIATEKKGLMDLLCEECDLKPGTPLYVEVLSQCLIDPDLMDTPILVDDIPQGSIDTIDAANDPNTNPNPEFCKAVMAANDVEAMAELFDDFKSFKKNGKEGDSQSGVYAGAEMFKKDIGRCGLKLEIAGKKIAIPARSFNDKCKTQDAFATVLGHLKKSADNGGAGLDDADALHVLKQIALAYRGQNGCSDASQLLLLTITKHTNLDLDIKQGGPDIKLNFAKKDGGSYILTGKEEGNDLIGTRSISKDGQMITDEIRFKFSGDPEGESIRTQLPVRSTRIPSADGTIKWSCPFRENPPKKIIFYGGCKSAGTQ